MDRWPESIGSTGWQMRKIAKNHHWRASSQQHPLVLCADLPQGGEHGEVLVDLQHGGVQQRVDVAQALEPSLQVLPFVAFQSLQLLWGQPGKAGGRHRHRGKGWREVEA